MKRPNAALASFVVALLLAVHAQAQQQPSPPTTPQRRALRVIVRDVSGAPLSGVKVALSGPITQDFVTDDNGTASLGALRDGTYRLRFDREGFVTLEREVSVRLGQPTEIYAALRISVTAPTPAPIAPAPPPPATPPPAAVAPASVAPPVFVSVPSFLEKNFLGREPIKESVLGCLSDSTTRLLQIHDAVAEHTHADVDEIIYVVAGEGTIRLRSDSSSIEPGALSIIPRGVVHAIDRRGRNPLIIISVLSGSPCTGGPAQTPTTKR
jgi:hypothetical protein